MGSERRLSLRVAVPGAWAELWVDGMLIAAAEIRDVSERGLFLAFPNPVIPKGTRVELRLKSGVADGTNLTGTIVSRVEGADPRHAGFGILLDEQPADTVEQVASTARPRPSSR
jgi:hypothetical protein